MRRAKRKLQLSYNVVGDDVEDQEIRESAGVEARDLRSVIFGLRMFDPTEINDENFGEVKISELNAMAEKVTAMRCEEVAGRDDRKFDVNPTDSLNGCIRARGDSASFDFDSSFDAASYLSWVKKFEESQKSDEQIMDFRRRELDKDKHARLEAAKKKAEDKKLLKWGALGYHSLSVRDPVTPLESDLMSESGAVQFVYGDCTKPSDVCPSEPTIIFRLVWLSGKCLLKSVSFSIEKKNSGTIAYEQ